MRQTSRLFQRSFLQETLSRMVLAGLVPHGSSRPSRLLKRLALVLPPLTTRHGRRSTYRMTISPEARRTTRIPHRTRLNMDVSCGGECRVLLLPTHALLTFSDVAFSDAWCEISNAEACLMRLSQKDICTPVVLFQIASTLRSPRELDWFGSCLMASGAPSPFS